MFTNLDETGRYLRMHWLGQLGQIADIALQRRMWLDPKNRNPHWSYVEFVCSFPDSDQLRDGRNKGWLTEDELRILSDFGLVLGAYRPPANNDYDNAAILEDAAWHEIVNAAAMARKEMLALVTVPAERDALLGKPS